MTGSFTTIHLERSRHVAWVTLARPHVLNAFNSDVIAELSACFGELAEDDDLRAVVLAGEGKAFCAGADVSWMQASVEATERENREDARAMAAMFRAIDECPAPVVGRVQGVAFGGGVGLVACCDVVVAAEDASFCFSEVRLGILPAVISTFSVAKIGAGQARRWFLTAEVLSSERARAIGLVHQVVPAAGLDAGVQDMVATLAANGPRAVREAKALIRRVAGLDRADALERCVETIARVRVSPEGQEGLRAFIQKREPAWRAEPIRVSAASASGDVDRARGEVY